MKPDSEVRGAIVLGVKTCAASEGKSVLVLWSMDRLERYVPQEEGLRLGQDSIEFIDNDGTKEVLLFSRIASVAIDEDDIQRVLATQEDAGRVLQFRKKR